MSNNEISLRGWLFRIYFSLRVTASNCFLYCFFFVRKLKEKWETERRGGN